MDLNELRLEIDKIDDQLVRLFVQRMDISAQIADYKKMNDLPIFVPAREEEKMRDVAKKAGKDMDIYARVLYDLLFELSRGYQSKCNAERCLVGAPRCLSKIGKVCFRQWPRECVVSVFSPWMTARSEFMTS